MTLKWMGCLAALAASAGLAFAEAPTTGELAAPSKDTLKPIPKMLPPAVTAAPPVVLPPPPAAPCAAAAPCASCAAAAPCESCAGKLFQEAGGCGCDDGYQIRANADYLLWFYRRDHVPVLFGTIPPALAGVNPLPPGSISPVFGGNHDALDYNAQSGARFGVEAFFDPAERFGLDVDYFQLQRGEMNTSAQSGPNGIPVVGPTFFDPTTRRQNLILFADPGLRSAQLALSSGTRFWGAEANFRTRLPSFFSDRTELLVGFRTVQFDQDLNVGGSSIAAAANPNPNAVNLNYQDSFWVHDHFYGPQIGLDSEATYKRFFLNVKGKFAVGEMDETLHINGVTTITAPAAFAGSVPGGVLAQRSNIGAYDRTVFTFLPELTVNAGVQVNENVRAFVGYNLIYIDQLQRVGPAIDGVDATQVSTITAVPNANANRPAFTFSDGRFWVQGVNVGLEVRY